MPLISAIGRRSLKVRITFALIYLVLAVGALSMLYPMALMVAGSVKSDTDFAQNTPVAEYLWDDNVLWTKYLESKYTRVDQVEQAHGKAWGSWSRVTPPASRDHALAESFRQFRQQSQWPQAWARLGHAQYLTLLSTNARRFRKVIQTEFHGDLAAYNHACDSLYTSWLEIGPPRTEYLTRRFSFPRTREYTIYETLKQDSPRADWIISDTDAAFVATALRSRWSTIAAYNAAHSTSYSDYGQILLATQPPAPGQARADWESYVRQELGLSFIRVAPTAKPAFIDFLRGRYGGRIALLNHAWEARFAAFEDLAVPVGVPEKGRQRADFIAFIKDACPLDALSVDGPRQAFEASLGRPRDSVRIPTETIDWLDFQQQKGALRREFLTRNYRTVIDYLALHSNGIRNTIIFCVLMIASNLLVNPIAAYALSRYRPRYTYAVLLFCMATMAFPSEVTMIPSFLLLKQFPFYSLMIGGFASVTVIWLANGIGLRNHRLIKYVVAVGIGLVVGWWLTPLAMQYFFHRADASVSLLNTFWALVLPGVANGFSIFLLKGFFDSLPPELYEAAELDGATEWHKFWMITMSLSKPILAVIALGVFTAAYSEFMMALVIIPDSRMWTMMVWLFQLQSGSHPSVVYASLVVAAVPTFSVFLFAQKLILRGIVVPTEK
jgi:multiple sugar transport system permease protein